MSTAAATATVPATPAMFSVAGLPSWVIDDNVLATVKDGLTQARVRPETTLAWCQAFLVGRPVDLAGFTHVLTALVGSTLVPPVPQDVPTPWFVPVAAPDFVPPIDDPAPLLLAKLPPLKPFVSFARQPGWFARARPVDQMVTAVHDVRAVGIDPSWLLTDRARAGLDPSWEGYMPGPSPFDAQDRFQARIRQAVTYNDDLASLFARAGFFAAALGLLLPDAQPVVDLRLFLARVASDTDRVRPLCLPPVLMSEAVGTKTVPSRSAALPRPQGAAQQDGSASEGGEQLLFQPGAHEAFTSLARQISRTGPRRSGWVPHMIISGPPGSGLRRAARLWHRTLAPLWPAGADVTWLDGREVDGAATDEFLDRVATDAASTRHLVVDHAEQVSSAKLWPWLSDVASAQGNETIITVLTAPSFVPHLYAQAPQFVSRATVVELSDYTTVELVELVRHMLADADLSLADSSVPAIEAMLAASGRKLPGAAAAENVAQQLVSSWAAGSETSRTITLAPPPSVDTSAQLTNALVALDNLVGLDHVKEQMRALVAQVGLFAARRDAGLVLPSPLGHMVFCGPPGTGKTTVARIVGDVFAAAGLLKNGHVVEVSRTDVVAGFVGQTGPRLRAAVDSAEGGVLFLDEAYALSDGSTNDFGPEAVAELVKLLEDRRGRFVLIAAGYTDQMDKFLATNPGLAGRFSSRLEFAPLTVDQCVEVFINLLTNAHMHTNATDTVREVFASFVTLPGFASARTARTLFDASVLAQGTRLFVPSAPPPPPELLTCLDAEDIIAAQHQIVGLLSVPR